MDFHLNLCKLCMAVAIYQDKRSCQFCCCCSLSGCRLLPSEIKHFVCPPETKGLASVVSMEEQEAGNGSLVSIYPRVLEH